MDDRIRCSVTAGFMTTWRDFVVHANQDQLFSLSEARRSEAILKAVYEKAGAPESFRMSYHEGPHKFDVPMQEEAFAWFDRWLR